ncbi:MAG TPA: hypothetical protein VE758_09825 [Chthoniobacterales bacterium]|nr:hypothetical protein [Chthoniobacterales bacterium]
MAPEDSDLIDLLDLKMLPAWVTEPAARDYFTYPAEDKRLPTRQAPIRVPERRMRKVGLRREHHGRDAQYRRRAMQKRERRPQQLPSPQIRVQFLPESRAVETVAVQIRAGAVAYSLFSLARLFLQEPRRYQVHLAAKPESALFQLGENGAISVNRQFLEDNAFRFAQSEFYRIETSQSEPIKGKFTSVAHDRLSGTLLGPTNHHSYQRRLRSLYEQRFRRRMSFADYQRQIQILTDPALVERWKEEARTVTTYTSLREEPPLIFNTAAEAERHFRKTYLSGLVRRIEERTINGLTSRELPDRVLRRLVEYAWVAQNRSPSQMMEELATRFRAAGLHIFRHRRGMLFVSPIRLRAFAYEEPSVSPHVQTILRTIAENPRTNRKELVDRLFADVPSEQVEPRKLALAADLHWLIGEGYVIEFNDGSLDLPRRKPKRVETTVSAAEGNVHQQVERLAGATSLTGTAEL